MSAPLISCIVPVFNGERYLEETLDSIHQQTYRPVEVIVVDDGSTDGTAAVVAAYGERVIYLYQRNAGPAAARNLGLDRASGELVAFLDADDLWQPEKLARQMAEFEARPDLDLCITQVQNFWVSELKQEEESFRNHRVSKPLPGYAASALLARRSVFAVVGNFNASMEHGHTIDWFLRASDCGMTVKVLPQVLVYRRLHHKNRSRMSAPHSREEFLRLVKAHLDRRRRET